MTQFINFYETLKTTEKTLLMGVLNITPDSFYRDNGDNALSAMDQAKNMLHCGADLIDIGAESSRPGANVLSKEEEIQRIQTFIEGDISHIAVPRCTLSIDTYKPQIAKYALQNGMQVINDITGFTNPEMIKVAAEFNCPVIVMHMQGTPQNMQNNPSYTDVVDEICTFFKERIKALKASGIHQIILDPGIGFGKTLEHNLTILKNIKTFKELGFPVLIGASRKSMMKDLNAGETPKDRLSGTLATHLYASMQGANILRVHDVEEHKQALNVWEKLV